MHSFYVPQSRDTSEREKNCCLVLSRFEHLRLIVIGSCLTLILCFDTHSVWKDGDG